MRLARGLFFLFLIAFSLVFPKLSHAESYPASTTGATSPYVAPKMDSNVPRNQHTFIQAATIEVLSAIMCQLSGIDPIDPSSPCLGINPVTRQLGYAPSKSEKPQLGGLIGISTDLIASTYRPIVTTEVYTQYLSENFGIVKKVHAQYQGYGFEGLRPVFKLWETVRNVSYGLLIIAFAFIGIGIMLRIKIDPRTVMSIQNQIPRVIISIILITFSYAISALMIDLMWTTTYAGMSMLSENANTPKGSESLAEKANKDIISSPLSFTNQIFETHGNFQTTPGSLPTPNTSQSITSPGIFHITQSVSNNVGEILRGVVKEVLGVDEGEKCFNSPSLGGLGNAVLPGSPFGDSKPIVDLRACTAGLLAFIASVVLKIIILVILVTTLFRIWFMLLKAYVYSILYIIVSPIYIAFGLLPSKPLGFEKWIRALFANLAVFPLTAFLIMGARFLMDAYNAGLNNNQNLFVPPLVGNAADVNFGALMAFGALLIGPSIQKILQDKLGVKGVGSPGLIAAGLTAGAAVVGAPAGRAMKHLNRVDSQGRAVGALARFKRSAGDTTLKKLGGTKIPFVSGKAEQVRGRREAIYNRSHYTSEAQAREEFEQQRHEAPFRERAKPQAEAARKRAEDKARAESKKDTEVAEEGEKAYEAVMNQAVANMPKTRRGRWRENRRK